MDHVIPVSRAGDTCWDNVVTACGRATVVKGVARPTSADAGAQIAARPRYLA